MTKPLPHRPGKGNGQHRPPETNSYRLVGAFAYVDVSTHKHPNAETVIDAADLPLVIDGQGRWYAFTADSRNTYAVRCLWRGKKVVVRLHRHLHGLGGGHAAVVDHKDRDGLNNRRNNHRLTDHGPNRANGRGCKSAEKFKGVFRRIQRTGAIVFRAKINKEGRNYSLGNFDTATKAALAYDAKARDLFGEFAFTNFPQPQTEIKHDRSGHVSSDSQPPAALD